MRIYTRKGDDGTTGLLFGGRVPKDSTQPRATGEVDDVAPVAGLGARVADLVGPPS